MLQPVEAAFGDVAAPVGRPVEEAAALTSPDTAVGLIDTLRDRRFDAAPTQVGADLRRRLALVRHDECGAGPGSSRPAPLDADAAITASNCVQSLTLPAVRVKAGGRPWPSQGRWISWSAQRAAEPSGCGPAEAGPPSPHELSMVAGLNGATPPSRPHSPGVCGQTVFTSRKRWASTRRQAAPGRGRPRFATPPGGAPVVRGPSGQGWRGFPSEDLGR